MSIEVEHLTKSYKIKKRSIRDNSIKYLVAKKYSFATAVNDISFTIQTGDIVGFIGKWRWEIYNHKNADWYPYSGQGYNFCQWVKL